MILPSGVQMMPEIPSARLMPLENLARRREGSGAAEVRNPQTTGESYLGGGERGAVGGDAGSVVEIQIIGDAANFGFRVAECEKLRVE